MKTVVCAGCGKIRKWYKELKTDFCRDCNLAKRCKSCGQMVSDNQSHKCVTVDNTERYCACGKKLNNIVGSERYRKNCARCDKKAWREKERECRQALREQFGGSCSSCGYDRCQSALHFHHKDSHEKYQWNVKGKTGASIREIKNHPERFQLLCANCHIELHDKERKSVQSESKHICRVI